MVSSSTDFGQGEDQKFKGTMKALKVSTELETKQIFSNSDGCRIRLTNQATGAKAGQLPHPHPHPGRSSLQGTALPSCPWNMVLNKMDSDLNLSVVGEADGLQWAEGNGLPSIVPVHFRSGLHPNE